MSPYGVTESNVRLLKMSCIETADKDRLGGCEHPESDVQCGVRVTRAKDNKVCILPNPIESSLFTTSNNLMLRVCGATVAIRHGIVCTVNRKQKSR